LSIALVGAGADLASFAAVQLAAVVSPADPARAVDLALPRFDRGHPFRVREAASEVVTEVVASGRDAPHHAMIESAVARLPRELERRLELALARTDQDRSRQRLQRLLEASTSDLVALEAAESLLELEPLPAAARWRVATTLFDHALYDRAAPLFEGLQDVRDGAVPRDDAAFLRGRCAFRRGRWSEAIDWYTRALALSRTNGRRADLEAHIGRSHELAGNLDAAVEAAVRAVRFDTTDDRRLFLARLRLRCGETELAAQGLSRLRSRTARAQGEVMLGLAAIRRGDSSSAQAHLGRARRAPWSAPATVFEAELMVAAGDAGAALEILDRSWRVLGPFWDEQARAVMARLPKKDVEAWRSERRQAVAAADGHSRWRELARWAVLEPDTRQLAEIGRGVEASFESTFQDAPPPFPAGLSGDLWRLGLERESANWDPGGFPRGDAGESTWSAQRFLDFELPWLALRAADRGCPRGSCPQSSAGPCSRCPTRQWCDRRRPRGRSTGVCSLRWRARSRDGIRGRCRRWAPAAWCS
jgi:tetratricopeptide (TPR) repeat protein